MKWLDVYEEPIRLYGLADESREKKNFCRLPKYVIEQLPQYELLGRRNVGVRARFQTNAKSFTIRMHLESEALDIAMALPAAAGLDVYAGIGEKSRYLGYLAPTEYGYEDKIFEKEFKKTDDMEVITINFPRNERVKSMQIAFPEDAEVLPAPDYTIERPILYYGSSITEGGCAPRPGAAYTSIVSRWLDSDYRNYGFSGGARGDLPFADFIGEHKDATLLVYDYDHNSPSPEHLAETHYPFYLRVREVLPKLPIVMISRPDFDGNIEDSIRRREVIQTSYQKALDRGDENVYFIDGEELFGTYGRAECTIDGCHPTGLGFMRMAEKIYPVLKQILHKN